MQMHKSSQKMYFLDYKEVILHYSYMATTKKWSYIRVTWLNNLCGL